MRTMRRTTREHADSRMDRLRFRIEVVELLRFLKDRYTYSQLSQITGLPATVLSRYIQGHVLPNFERARELWSLLNKRVNLKNEIVDRIRFNGNGFIDNTAIIYDPFVRRYMAMWIYDKITGTRVDKILTAAVDGIPLAVTLSDRLSVPVVIAKKSREVGVDEFWTTELAWPSGRCEMLYVPKRWLRKKDWIVIVDDVIRTGETQRALIELVRRVGAKLAGLFALISIGDWRSKVPVPEGCMAEVLITLNDRGGNSPELPRSGRGEKPRVARRIASRS
ncbi:adenine phosphoribosyltransferase [Candidatus Bathyarchaeota archaeon]|nr:MAG: adenine phosphoribosyltransferase [Candidatus Bathyarchaeota archaeon]